MESAVIDREKDTFTTNGDYEQTRQEIISLLHVEEDEDFVRPTRYALDLTLNLRQPKARYSECPSFFRCAMTNRKANSSRSAPAALYQVQ